ncbi:GYD domain-containing protein [Bradyrhizobium sp. UFLA05-112]
MGISLDGLIHLNSPPEPAPKISASMRSQTMAGVMIRLFTRGCFTENYAKGLVSAPEDREPAVRRLIEGAGGKLVSFYFTTGDSDFMLISEADESESIIAALLAAVAAGAISGVKTARAWTGAEFKGWLKGLPKQLAIIELPARAKRDITTRRSSAVG